MKKKLLSMAALLLGLSALQLGYADTWKDCRECMKYGDYVGVVAVQPNVRCTEGNINYGVTNTGKVTLLPGSRKALEECVIALEAITQSEADHKTLTVDVGFVNEHGLFTNNRDLSVMGVPIAQDRTPYTRRQLMENIESVVHNFTKSNVSMLH